MATGYWPELSRRRFLCARFDTLLYTFEERHRWAERRTQSMYFHVERQNDELTRLRL